MTEYLFFVLWGSCTILVPGLTWYKSWQVKQEQFLVVVLVTFCVSMLTGPLAFLIPFLLFDASIKYRYAPWSKIFKTIVYVLPLLALGCLWFI